MKYRKVGPPQFRYMYRVMGDALLSSGYRYKTATEAQQAAEATIAFQWPHTDRYTYEVGSLDVTPVEEVW